MISICHKDRKCRANQLEKSQMSTLHQPLAKNLRIQLENTVKSARNIAEIAAEAALTNLGVDEKDAHSHLTDEQKLLRRRLRAHGRQLGDVKHKDDSQEIRHLVWEVAYELWHRMLFARFLAENQLLMWEPGAPVTLAECDELAQDANTSMGAKSGWELAGILAARMLPQIFKQQSPALMVIFAPEHQKALEKLLLNLSNEIFVASDSLGWVYQFWQDKRKDEVNNSEVKIGADELPAVTQLFTETYMVEFQLHNSLGAWWHTRYPDKQCPVKLTYLRFLDDGTPAAGTFEGWPTTLADFKLLDPCCGSGHFLVAAFLILVPMRMSTEGLSTSDAVDAVLENNLHGLELDPRCVEIAAFALALAAWTYPDAGNFRQLPRLNVACCGLRVSSQPDDWLALIPADHSQNLQLKQELKLLHSSMQKAPLLGSLLDPWRFLKNDLATSDYTSLQKLLTEALAVESQSNKNEEKWEAVVSAQGLLVAASLLAARYHLVVTNVPYLVRGKQLDVLKDFCETYYNDAKNDLANVFLERCLELSMLNGAGAIQVVIPQNWLFQSGYKKQRERLLKEIRWNFLAQLGTGAFETISGEVVNVILLTQTNIEPLDTDFLRGVSVSAYLTPTEKAEALKIQNLKSIGQKVQLVNPDLRVSFDEKSSLPTLSDYADSIEGLSSGDLERFILFFWEIPNCNDGMWNYFQRSPDSKTGFTGCRSLLRWENGNGALSKSSQARVQGHNAWGKKGVLVNLMSTLNCSLYSGAQHDKITAAIVPKHEKYLAPIWAYCSSEEYNSQVRKLNPALQPGTSTLVKVPFDLIHWQNVADKSLLNGVTSPYSDDPTQWMFHGHPQCSNDTLQVLVGRLLGYTWPADYDNEMALSDDARKWILRSKSLDLHVDDDGIVCLSPVRGEKSAHERLLALLIDSWESVESGSWKSSILDKLLFDNDCEGKGLDIWLRDKFFEQHSKRFHHRPFIWHVWDGLKDGFGALVNYHKLDAKNLERLIHTYLGDWIRSQEAAVISGIDGASIRLLAARQLKIKLEAIREGEAPYDIFVRWKSLPQQCVGWNPDLNDGVRMNIRPFMTAEVLRHNKKPKLNITWDKDRGKDVESAPWFSKFNGERINDYHLTLAEKLTVARNKL